MVLIGTIVIWSSGRRKIDPPSTFFCFLSSVIFEFFWISSYLFLFFNDLYYTDEYFIKTEILPWFFFLILALFLIKICKFRYRTAFLVSFIYLVVKLITIIILIIWFPETVDFLSS